VTAKICITDDHSIVRAGIRQILELEPDLRVVEEAANAQDFLKRCLRSPIDLVILDLTLPDMNGFELIAKARRAKPNVPILVLSMHGGEQYALRAFEEGAAGYLTKETAVEELVSAVRAVLAGRKYVTPALARILEGGQRGDRPAVVRRLSQRERQVLVLLASGNAVGEIAQQLDLDKRTVSTYKSRLLEKLSLRSTADLVRFALEQGLIT